MQAPPNWTPTLGERHGAWVGVAVGSLTVWDYVEPLADDETTLNATPVGNVLPSGIGFTRIYSGSSTDRVHLPAATPGEEYEGFVDDNGFAMQAKSAGSSATINDVDCLAGSDRAAAIPAKTYWKAVCVTTNRWFVQIHTLGSANTPTPS